MMVDGAEEGQLGGLIDVLTPYTSRKCAFSGSRRRNRRLAPFRVDERPPVTTLAF
jgi:hypothetical protein